MTPASSSPSRRRAQLKLHDRYLGHMRNLEPRQKAQVKAVKASKAIARGGDTLIACSAASCLGRVARYNDSGKVAH